MCVCLWSVVKLAADSDVRQSACLPNIAIKKKKTAAGNVSFVTLPAAVVVTASSHVTRRCE